MRFNESAVKHVARQLPVDREGRLDYRSPKENYRERWFRLKGNLLFLFRTTQQGSIGDSEALGVLVIEQCSFQLEPVADRPFVFSIAFAGESKHYFSGQSEKQCEDWVTSLQTASIENLQSQLIFLRDCIKRKTGKDPVDALMSHSFQRRRREPSVLGSSTFFRNSAPPAVTLAANPIARPSTNAKSAPKELLLNPSGLIGWETFE